MNTMTQLRYDRLGVLLLAGTMLYSCTLAARADQYLPAVGGGGGDEFRARCASGEILVGLDARSGDDIDAIRPVCAVPREASGVEPSPQEATWHGGPGGSGKALRCPGDKPVVHAMYIAAAGVDTVVVDNINLYCGWADGNRQSVDTYPSDFLRSPLNFPDRGILIGSDVDTTSGSLACPQGTMAVGIHGRSGAWLDALGLICDDVALQPAKALGKVRPPPSQPPLLSTTPNDRVWQSPEHRSLGKVYSKPLGKVRPDPPAVDPPICQRARAARGKFNAATQAALDTQCRNAGGNPE